MPDGTVIPSAYDGKEMWDALEGLSGDEDGDGMAKWRQQRVEEIRDTQLPDNCSPQMFANVLVEFNELNELIDNPYDGKSYSKFVLNILPDSLDTDRRSLKRELLAAAKMDDSAHVVQKVKSLIADAYKPNAQPMMKVPVAAWEKLVEDVEDAKKVLAATFARSSRRKLPARRGLACPAR